MFFFVWKYPFLSIWKIWSLQRIIVISTCQSDSVHSNLTWPVWIYKELLAKKLFTPASLPLLRKMGFSFIIIDLWTAAFHSSLDSEDKPNAFSCPRTQVLQLSAVLTRTSISKTTCKALQTSRKTACVSYRCDTWELPCFSPRLSINDSLEFSSRDPEVVPRQKLTQPAQCCCWTVPTF